MDDINDCGGIIMVKKNKNAKSAKESCSVKDQMSGVCWIMGASKDISPAWTLPNEKVNSEQ